MSTSTEDLSEFRDFLAEGCTCSTSHHPPCSFCEIPNYDNQYKQLAHHYAAEYHLERADVDKLQRRLKEKKLGPFAEREAKLRLVEEWMW